MRQMKRSWLFFLLVLMLLLVLAVLLSLSCGEMRIRFWELLQAYRNPSSMAHTILYQIRLPRIVMAISVGGSLGLTGAILQGIFRNPLVEPYTLGISGGAAFGVSLAIVAGLQLSVSAYSLPLAGFAGALASIFLVFSLSINKGQANITRMLLVGVMVSFIASSSMMFMMSITTSDNLHGIIFWTMGSLDEPKSELIKLVFFSSLAGLALSYLFARPLNALRLGEAQARHLGINTVVTIRLLFVIASLLTGVCVSVAGIIGFVGLIIPHIIRSIIGSDYRVVLLGSFLGGSVFLVISDILARTIISPNELPIGVITGMVGGLVFILILKRMKAKR